MYSIRWAPTAATHDLTHIFQHIEKSNPDAAQRVAQTIYDAAIGGLSTSLVQRLPGGASRLAALLLPQILPVFSVVAPCQSGAALRNPLHNRRGQATSLQTFPERGRVSRRPGARELVFSPWPYILVYRIEGDHIEIARLWHAAQDWHQ